MNIVGYYSLNPLCHLGCSGYEGLGWNYGMNFYSLLASSICISLFSLAIVV